MNEDLNLHGLQYNTAVTLFYVPYTLLEVPSNVVLKLMRPSLWISILLFSWGLVMTCNFSYLVCQTHANI